MSTALVKGSVSQIARAQSVSLAQAWIGVDVVVIVDCSGSMSSQDAQGGKSRYEQACAELALLQERNPGKIGVFSFNDSCAFSPSGIPWRPGGGTDLGGALNYCRQLDTDGMRFVVISDGAPDSEAHALAEACRYKSRIDCIYVGNEAHSTGRDFLQRLTEASGGALVTASCANLLADSVQRLLEGI